MKVILDIPSYSENSGIVFKWEGDFQIKVVSEDGDVGGVI
jgi:NADH dehydrogenase/NADH:ubiquinone oxidoreductase subunit G